MKLKQQTLLPPLQAVPQVVLLVQVLAVMKVLGLVVVFWEEDFLIQTVHR
jgi:hypothetical protein